MDKLKDREWLSRKYVVENLSMSQIGDLLGCTKHPVYRALKRFRLQARAHTSKYPQLNDKEWLRSEYIDRKQSTKQIADSIGCTIGVVHSALTHANIPTRSYKEGLAVRFESRRIGETASNWRGGRRLSGGGYMAIYSPDHPLATTQKLVMEHRLVMEQEIGRYLTSDEVIHHINGEKLDNRIENLLLLPNREVHAQLHFEACKEVAYLKAVLEAHDIKYKPYEYECLKYLQ